MTARTAQLAYSLEEAAEAMSLSVSYLRRAVRSGQLRAKRIGQKYRISDDDLRAWFEALPDA